MEVAGEIVEEDYLRAQWLHVKPRRRYRIAGYVVLALFVLTSIPVVVTSVSLRNSELAFSFFGPVVALVALAALQLHMHRRTYRRQPSLQGTHRYTFNEDRVASQSPLGTGEAEWSVFTKWREDSRIFILYQAENLFHMLPKRWFDGDETKINEFRDLLEAKMLPRVDGK